MALSDNFYKEIFDKEKYWLGLADKKLLNVYYLTGKNGLRDFYLSKQNALTSQPNIGSNAILSGILDVINAIIFKIDVMEQDYKAGKDVNFNELTSLFLINKMGTEKNDTLSKEEENAIRAQVRGVILAYLKEMKDDYENYTDNELEGIQKVA